MSEDERNTPQAFSHFTYEASGKQMLLCDVQGVGDMYTGMDLLATQRGREGEKEGEGENRRDGEKERQGERGGGREEARWREREREGEREG